jgi:hypothetical protein
MQFATRNSSKLGCGVVVFFVLGLIIFFMTELDTSAKRYGVVGPVITLAATFLICSLPWWLLWDRHLYLFHISGETLLTLSPNRPSRAAVQDFLDRLLAEARERGQHDRELAMVPSANYDVIAEIRAFHALLETDVITTEEFRAKKAELLSAYLGS